MSSQQEPQLDQKPQSPSEMQHLSTRLQHHPYQPPAGFGAVEPGVHHASTVIFPDVATMRARDWRSKAGYTYGLHGTPTTFILEERLAVLDGGRHCVLCPSGLSAIALVDLTLLKQGDTVLLPGNVYGPSRELAERFLGAWGIQHQIYEATCTPEELAKLITPQTKLLWLEAPGSVTMEMPDLRGLIAVARQHGILTAIDATWAAGIALQPFDLGVDVVMQALTKYQSGGADLLMGSVTTRDDALHERLLLTHMRLGLGVGADDVARVLRGLHTLPLRYAAQDASARRIALWMQDQPQVAQVLHPALPGSPGHAHWQRDCTAAAGLFSVVFDARYTAAQVDAFVDALQLFKIGYSWGGPVSLAVPYDVQAMRPAGRWPHQGGLVRLAIGLEDPQDLIDDLRQAMQQMF
ncbi:Cystathionine beta-lyase [Thiomonas arsenitoxydans]|uniref:Cystathionine beta-lyase n=2 Tax=Thiomonas arsenitoxydans (strain DSM 22701 / CIP 110005 / 3As) TaxID=426114 RepID=D6CTZ7_THIA3|nr:putative cystathionine beta-lyase [Thiomonas arsenitoxydans]CQR41258.1 Cystathionine beta-lyase [Thiomonas sp. CB3]CQR26359.1 Cystathionine beta-lyase [Thiomonas arsenitoxydans]CQR28235.1 Cystathionine beta-lyase [Thiomonas arsenitoxydans]CQR35146.1 Cystathionine beta-lyase [Thiomonas arsenitoxydans]